MRDLSNIKFYMKIDLPDGTHTDGKIDYRKVPDNLGIADLDLSNRRVLDIAANDGFWSFWAESRGSSDVLAIDVDSFEGYDWSYGGAPESFKTPANAPSQWTEAGSGFAALRDALKSDVKRRNMSVYDLNPADVGTFDVIFNFGLLYHLRHPLLSLDRCRAVCSGMLILETHVINGFDDLPVSLFYNQDELDTITNWTGPTPASCVQWLHSAGFPRIFSNRTNQKSPYARRIFIACINDEWAKRFEGNTQLIEFDDEWFEKSKSDTRNLLKGRQKR